jgi:uncharacterized protein (TIGR02646 family)
MRTIHQTSPPPACLARQPAEAEWGTFGRSPCYVEVADHLRAEQHHLCCYCELQITPEDSHVEHLVPRRLAPGGTYEYANLAASCNGGQGQDRHCGHRKGGEYDATVFVSPHSAAAGALFSYGLDGLVRPADPHAPAAATAPRLHGRRVRHARLLIETLGQTPDPALLSWARDYYLRPDANCDLNGRLRQFPSLSRALLT